MKGDWVKIGSQWINLSLVTNVWLFKDPQDGDLMKARYQFLADDNLTNQLCASETDELIQELNARALRDRV